METVENYTRTTTSLASPAASFLHGHTLLFDGEIGIHHSDPAIRTGLIQITQQLLRDLKRGNAVASQRFQQCD
jgi:hypothetical protein